MSQKIESPYGPLNAAEERVILQRGTEMPGTGEYLKQRDAGIYACRNCGAPLYRADDQFDSGCGWPAFDDEIPCAVKRTPDPDGRRIEIRCARCGGHLGHVFRGEKLTPKDVRHCVNSISLRFEPQVGGRLQRAVFAGGCFWGVEALMKQLPGVLAGTSGYTGGRAPNPNYQEVCSGNTGHAEAVEVVFDATRTDFEKLCRYFLEIHDPTQMDRQGPDRGSQYRSAIFYLDEKQQECAAKLLDILRKRGYDIKTQLEPFRRFWNAESYHQDYYERTGGAPYCHSRVGRFDED